MISSAGAILPSAIKNILSDLRPVAMKGSLFNVYLPQSDTDGFPQLADAPALAIDVL